ncbi:cell division protein CrgA [Paenarthrobacter sp. Z7-10]|uniref:cell division protein CrgA n=1 Tax=Paenarthrobacter sp. Z7-10 TaxID=2787635 RepID=UPI0022A9170D|nr:cell division protein CrgA [Paenarthrobacter sp. Z7-10]MCZ2403616.1 cell division protein CrgA [Paenarthrobacter sp. Z7-10]
MPESKSRRRSTGASQQQSAVPVYKPNPVWFKPVMFSLMVIGLIWIIVYYITNGQWPVPNIANWNLVIGFGIVIIGFLMTTRWRS